jgi:putative ABC transport system permease protein
MTWFARWRRRSDADRDLADEIQFHLDAEARLRSDRGEPAVEARAGARRDFGNVLDVAQTTREMWGWSPASIIDDIQHGLRRLRAKPSTALTAAGMLALGIGLATAMFTLVDALVLRPAPFREPDRLMRLELRYGNNGRTVVPPAVLAVWRTSPLFSNVAGASTTASIVDTEAGALVRASARVSPGLFDLLGVHPSRGRAFTADEGRAGADAVVLLSEDLWRTTFASDPRILGRTITVDGARVQVIGLMPSGFRFPDWNTVIWQPIDFDAPPSGHEGDLPMPFARLAPGVTAGAALAAAAVMARAASSAVPANTWVQMLAFAGSELDAYYTHAVPILSAGVVLVFLVLCANVGSLLLARLTSRAAEFRMCVALGASRGRLLREAMFEHVAIAAGGAVAGVSFAWGLVRIARALLPEAFLSRTLHVVTLDARALVVALGAAFAATLAAGVVPAWIATRPVARTIAASGRGGTESRAGRAMTRTLLVVELSMACGLLVLATLLVRSFMNLAAIDRGLDTDGVLTMRVLMPSTPADPATRAVVAAAVKDRLRALPGVAEMTVSGGVPPGGGATHFDYDWQPFDPGAKAVHIAVAGEFDVGPDFFHLYRISLLEGRGFEAGDDEHAVILGERLAHLLWPTGSAVGRSFTLFKTEAPYHVVGVARELRFPTVDAFRDHPQFYAPFTGRGLGAISLRCTGTCPDEATVRRAVLAGAPGATIYGFGLLDDVYREALARPRGAAALGTTFAVIAMAAAAGGLFSVLTYAVGRRRREFGVRLALGAAPGDIRRLVLRDGLRVAGLGIVIGGAGSVALARIIASIQYGVSKFDPITYGIVVVLLVATTLLASWRPARRAMTVDPAELLRDE